MAAQQPFAYPKFHAFPPMYTPQPNQNTRQAQLAKWSTVAQDFCAHYHIFRLPASATPDVPIPRPRSASTPTSSTVPTADNPWRNDALGPLYRISDAFVREVLSFMAKDGRAEQVQPSSGSAGAAGDGSVWWIHWRRPDEWADRLEGWVEETGQRGAVLTLYEITDGDKGAGTDFEGMETAVLQKALAVLVKRGKAEVFGTEDSQGVKFF